MKESEGEPVRIRLSWEGGSAAARLKDTPTTRKLVARLPLEGVAQTWGDEVYFELPIPVEREPDAQQVVDPGTVCFWVEGSALALPFGPTPISRGSECRLVAPCNILGQLEQEAGVLASIEPGDTVRLETPA